MNWNDRRKANKAASNTMKTTLGQMAKTGALRGTTPPDKKDTMGLQKHDAEMERSAVRREASNIQADYSYMDRGSSYKEAAKRIDKKGKK
jgi:hypothetical protein